LGEPSWDGAGQAVPAQVQDAELRQVGKAHLINKAATRTRQRGPLKKKKEFKEEKIKKST
jgi:hypothetical protein